MNRLELQFDWEIAGFIAEEEGSLNYFWHKDAPDEQLPVYELSVTKEVPTLEEAVRAIQWISTADSETWL